VADVGPGPAVSIRRLGPGDVAALETLARDDPDFDLDPGRGPRTPLDALSAEAFLADSHVLHWTAWAGPELVGALLCHVLPMRKQPARELLLFEIGVRTSWRRRGVGRRLLAEMIAWMRAEAVTTAWVLADNPDAERFYASCGFVHGPAPAYLELRL
jgi:GNAT superfamily N-acetyltransferase